MDHSSRSALLGLMTLLAVVGCGRGYPTARVEGQVTVNGQPVEQGNITFTPLQADRGPGATATIESGRYVVQDVPQGKVRVDFYAVKPTGRTAVYLGKTHPINVNIIPEEYAGGLEFEVDGKEVHKDFSL
jgi:hypothetical protein